jgi:hypothetical protein
MSLVSAGLAGLVAGGLIAVAITQIFRASAWAQWRRAGSNIAGSWHGWSVYLPVDGYFFEDHEAIYRTNATFKQRGKLLTMHEHLVRIYDIDGRLLEHIPARRITCRGRFFNGMDAVVSFTGEGARTSGSMYLALDAAKQELYGMLVVRPRKNARPVAVKILLRRSEVTIPTLEELGIDRIRRLSAPEQP